MAGFFVLAVLVSCDILTGARTTSVDPPSNRQATFRARAQGSPGHRVFASSARGSKQRCAASCSRETACAHFCYEATTKRCLLAVADQAVAPGSEWGAGNMTCYDKSHASACTNTFSPGTYANQIFPFPAFDGEFLLEFGVQIPADAMVSLSVSRNRDGVKYEVVLGKGANSRTTIRRWWSQGDLVTVLEDGVVSGDEMRRFWLRYDRGSFAVGKHEMAPYLEWTDPTPPADPPRFIGLGGWAHVGYWIIYNKCVYL